MLLTAFAAVLNASENVSGVFASLCALSSGDICNNHLVGQCTTSCALTSSCISMSSDAEGEECVSAVMGRMTHL